MKYEVCTENTYIGTINVDCPSLTVFQNFLRDLGYPVKKCIPMLDTRDNWYLEDLKYHFKAIK